MLELKAKNQSGFLRINDSRVIWAMSIMERHMSAPLSITAIASAVGVNTRQLARLFARNLHDSPSGFYRKLRLWRVNWLLKHSTKSSAEIAAECGFVDGAHLSRRYKEMFGLPPGQDRMCVARTGLGLGGGFPG
ncbi:hypothetical protein C4J81_15015 [Deltaproteobacteria bacterium Smac51]|nr:hypothetical protein C4J81_15015 [Deltaproteobacteria bacterium Smac51]